MSLLGRFAALESDVGVELDIDETVVDREVEVAADVNAEATDEAEVTETVAESEEINEATEALENFLTAVIAAKNNGGLTNREAAILGVGMESSLSGFGFSSTEMSTSLESYNANTERERISQTESVENAIKDGLKKLWEAIKRMVRKAIAFVRKWYLKIFDGASRMKRQAQALRKKADNTSGTIKEKKIRTGVLGTLHIAKNMPKASEISKSIEVVTKLYEDITSGKMVSSYSDLVDKVDFDELAEKVDADTKANKQDRAAVNGYSIFVPAYWTDAQKKYHDNFTALSNLKSSKEYGQPFNNLVNDDAIKGMFEFASSDVLLGNVRIQVAVPDSELMKSANINDPTFAARIKHANIWERVYLVEASSKKLEIDESKEVETLSSSDVSSICSSVEALCDAVIDYKKGFEKYESTDKKLLAKLEKVDASKLDKYSDDVQVGKAIRSVARAMSSTLTNKNASISTLTSYGMKISRAALSYGSQSLSQYKDD